MKSFAEVMRGFAPSQDLLLPPSWSQGRTVYGGISSALALEAALRCGPENLPPLRSGQVAFVGPAAGPLRFETRVLREGKSSVSTSVDCFAHGEAALRSVFVFGRARDSAIAHDFSGRPDVAGPDRYARSGAPDGAPAFLSNFDLRFAGGSGPGTGSDNPEFIAWVRHRDDGGVHPVVSLIAIADSLPPAALASFNGMAPVSSVAWSFDILRTPTTAGWMLLRSFSQHASDGYSVQDMEVWDESGARLLVGRQSVALYQ